MIKEEILLIITNELTGQATESKVFFHFFVKYIKQRYLLISSPSF